MSTDMDLLQRVLCQYALGMASTATPAEQQQLFAFLFTAIDVDENGNRISPISKLRDAAAALMAWDVRDVQRIASEVDAQTAAGADATGLARLRIVREYARLYRPDCHYSCHYYNGCANCTDSVWTLGEEGDKE